MKRRSQTPSPSAPDLSNLGWALAMALCCALFGAPIEPGMVVAQSARLYLPVLGRNAEIKVPDIEFADVRHLGPVNDAAPAAGTRVYLAMGPFVALLDVQADGSMRPLGQSASLGSDIERVWALEGAALAITRDQRMVVVDFTRPDEPLVVWDQPTRQTFSAFIQDGPWLYAFGVPRDIVIYDLRDPRHPREAKILDLGCRGLGGMTLSGDLLVIGCKGLSVYDVTDPAGARLLGWIGDGFIDRSPTVVQGVAFFYGQLGGPTSRVNGWTGVDLTDPTRLSYWPDPPPFEVQVGWMVGDALYVQNDGFDVFRVDRRFKPELVGHVSLDRNMRLRAGRQHLTVLATVTSVLDVSDPFQPRVMARLQVPDNRQYHFHRYDGRAVYGLKGCPIELGPIMPWPAPCLMPELFGGVLMVEGGIGLQWDRGTLIAHDLIAKPPRRLWSVVLTDQPRGFEVDRQGDFLAVLVYGDRNPFRDVQVFVIAMRGEQAGRVLGRMTPTPYAIQAMRIAADGTVYLIHDLGIEALLIRGREVVEVPLPMPHDEPAYEIRIEGNGLYALGRDGPLKRLIRVFDIADPAAPRLVNLVPVPRRSRTMEIFDGVAYVNADLVLAIDVGASPRARRVIGVLHRPDAPWCQESCWLSMFKVGDQLMLHDTGSGFWLVRPIRRVQSP